MGFQITVSVGAALSASSPSTGGWPSRRSCASISPPWRIRYARRNACLYAAGECDGPLELPLSRVGE